MNTTKDNIPDPWATDAVQWAVDNGLLMGDAEGNYRLHDTCTRQDVLIFMDRLTQLLDKQAK